MEERYSTKRGALLAWAELAGLWVLAFGQQAFARIASGPEAFTQVGADRLDLLLLVLLVALLPPALFWLVELAILRLRSEEAARIFHGCLFGAAIGVFTWQITGGDSGLPIPLSAAILLAGGGTWLYLNARVARHFVELVSLATPVVIAFFLFTYPTSAQVLPSPASPPVAKIGARTPVVLVVFDELSLDSLLDREGRVDADLFPNLARLARHSTWYPNARAVSASTIRAVPTVMSGRLPRSGSDPTLSSESLPDNLCDLLKRGGYRIHALETITRFCGSRHSRPERLRALLSRTVENGTPEPSGSIPTFANGRAEELDGFIDGMNGNHRTLNFAHPMLPHHSWMYMPDGTVFTPEPDPEILLRPQRDFLFQQVMLQIGFIDRELGRLVKRMKRNRIWRNSLLVVTADHGLNMTFRGQADDLPETGQPTWDSRDLTAENAGTLLPIPLFVKFPGQRQGLVNRAEVTSADIAPTVLTELGVEPSAFAKIEGRPLQGDLPARIDPVRALSRVGNLTVSRATYRDARLAARRLRQRLFGGGTFFAPGGRPDLIGSPVGEHPGLRPLAGSADSPGGTSQPAAGRRIFRLAGYLPETTSAVAIAVDGIIAATATPWLDRDTGRWTLGTILPRSAFYAADSRITLHSIRKEADSLRPDGRRPSPGA